jgi:hypothetical protein
MGISYPDALVQSSEDLTTALTKNDDVS